MSHWFDRLALSAAEGPRMTRRATLQRATVAVLAAAPLAGLAARAGAAPDDSCEGCQERVRRIFASRQTLRVKSVGRAAPARLSPLALFVATARHASLGADSVGDKLECLSGPACEEHAPAPGAPRPPQPPPTTPDLCAPCLSVGGKCCYGADPNAPCACIPPGRQCSEFCS